MEKLKDDRGYSQIYKESAAVPIRMERRCDYMIGQMSNLSAKHSILEIGCGTGDMAYMMAKKIPSRVVGTDLCEPFIESANQNYQLPNLSYRVLDFNNDAQIQALPIQKFDYIVGNGILHHLYHHLDHALERFKFLLNQGGKIIFIEPNIYNPYIALIFQVPFLRTWASLEPDEMAFSPSFIRKKLVTQKYRDIKIEFKDFLLPNTPESLIKPVIAVGDVVEKIPLVKAVSQSIFISATRGK
jgi:2-polyprenyl-3-methyl-5-hydroxy-6-metoxy-1,4-benzoquinol methylase